MIAFVQRGDLQIYTLFFLASRFLYISDLNIQCDRRVSISWITSPIETLCYVKGKIVWGAVAAVTVVDISLLG